MCARIARNDQVELPDKFWNIKKWKNLFRLQLKFANDLIKRFSTEAIIRSLRTFRGQKVYSLGAKWFYPEIESEQKKVDQETKTLAAIEPSQPAVSSPQTQRPVFSVRKTRLQKLKEAENGGEGHKTQEAETSPNTT